MLIIHIICVRQRCTRARALSKKCAYCTCARSKQFRNVFRPSININVCFTSHGLDSAKIALNQMFKHIPME